MFVLDVSGSMSGKADPDCPSNCKSKIEVLKNSAISTTNYWHTWNLLNPANDRIGVTLFRNSAIPSNFSGYALIDVNATNIQTVNDYIDNIYADGLTSMGDGLLSAIGNLNDPGRIRNIVLFTDGRQNTIPNVIKDPPDPGAADYTLTINSTVLDENIRIFPIGITSPINQYLLLEDIARKTQGASYLSYYIEDDLTSALINSLIMAMKNKCPQMVSSKKGKIEDGHTIETIQLDNYKHRIAFLLNGFGTDNSDLSLEIMKNDVNLTSYGTLTDLGHFKAFVMQMPVIHEGNLIHSGGEWNIRISSNENQEYEMYTIVDEYQLDYECKILPSSRNAGDPIEFEADISFIGEPIFEDITIEAFISKPGEDLGTIMSTRSVKNFVASRIYILKKDIKFLAKISDKTFNNDALNPADKKLYTMLENAHVRDLLTPVSSKVTLTHDGDGHFSGSYTDTDVTGPYQVLFKISGVSPGLGSFQRIEMHCTVRGFGESDLNNSGNYYVPRFLCIPDRIIIRPVNQFKNYLGPGNSQMIQSATSQGKATKIIDNLDGSYTLVFKDQKLDTSTIIKTTVGGKIYYSGKISSLSQKLTADAKILKRRARIRIR